MAPPTPTTDTAAARPDGAPERAVVVERIVDLDRALAEGEVSPAAVETLRTTLVAAIERAVDSVLVEPDGGDWRLRHRHDDGLGEVLLHAAALPDALAALRASLAAEAAAAGATTQAALHGAFALRLAGEPWWVELRALHERQGASYELTLHRRPLAPPRLDELGLDPVQLRTLRARLAAGAGWLPIGIADAAGGARVVRAVAQELVAPERRLVSVEPPFRPPLARVTQLGVEAAADVLDLELDAVLLAATPSDAVLRALASRAAEGTLVVQRSAARRPSATLARLLSLGLAPAWIAHCVPLVLIRHRLHRVCPACRIAAPADCNDAHWLETAHAPPVRDISAWLERSIDTRRYHRGAGCARCHESGHAGVRDVFDLAPLDAPARRALYRGDVETAFARVDAAGELSRRLRALVAGGEITAAEAARHLRPPRPRY